MKMVLIFLGYFVLVATVLCDCDENLTAPDVNNNFTQYIYLQFYKGPTVDDYISLPYKNALNLTNLPKFKRNLETIFYFPGWTEQPANHEESIDLIASAFLSKNSTNLVVFNYYQLVKGGNYFEYLDAFINVTNIGKSIGYFLKCYIPREQSIDLIHLVGHSLGGQIMSHSARVYGKGKLKWLTGLDPAGPLFNLPLIEHLSKQDAKFVDVIHTDGNFYGDGRSIGNVDFFPNMGRRVQPGCDNTTNAFCSHHMSWRFYAASIRNETLYPAKECNYNWFCNTFGIQNHFPYCCEHNSFVNYMGYGVNKTLKGNFYLKTSATPPYSLGTDGFY